MKNIYKCPICGREYDTPAALAACVQECAKEAEKEAIKKEENLRKANELEKKIKDAYTQLKVMVDEYNGMNTGKIYSSYLGNTDSYGTVLRNIPNFTYSDSSNRNFGNLSFTKLDNNALKGINNFLSNVLEESENIKKKDKKCSCGGDCKDCSCDSSFENFVTKVLGI